MSKGQRTRQRLRLGILLDQCKVPAWVYRALERITLSGCADIALIGISDSQAGPTPAGQRLWQGKDHLLYRIYDALDTRLFCREPDPLRLVDVRDLLEDVPTLRLSPIRPGQAASFAAADLARIKEQNLDILIALGANVPWGDIPQAARYGIWAYDYGHGLHHEGPPGLWEVAEGQPETIPALYMMGADTHSGRVLCRSPLSTFPFSPARNRHYCLWIASSLLPRQIELLYRLGEEEFFRRTADAGQAPEPHGHSLCEAPSNGSTLRLAARLCVRNLAELARRGLYLDQWYLLFYLGEDRQAPFCSFRALIPPEDRFWADPHVIEAGDTHYVFVEEYLYKARKGRISVMQIDRQGTCSNPVPVLEADYHLSYPFVFAWEGCYYMIPESAQNRTVDLYECVAFPYEWRFKMHLMENVKAVDSTLFFHQGKWWLFTGMAENEGAFPQVELFLFSSSDLFTSRWQPHPLNPIVSDVKRARPAGSILKEGGRAFRPSQDCSRTYGHGFDLNEVVVISESEYCERLVTSVRPDWDEKVEATHTFARYGSLTMIDARLRKRRRCDLSLPGLPIGHRGAYEAA